MRSRNPRAGGTLAGRLLCVGGPVRGLLAWHKGHDLRWPAVPPGVLLRTVVLVLAALSIQPGPAPASDTAAEIGEARRLVVEERLDEAIAIVERLASETEAATGPNHPDAILLVAELARYHFLAGRYDQALSLAEESIQRTVAGGGEGTAFHATLVAERGKMAGNLGRLMQAEADLRLALETLERELPPDHPRILDILRSLAIVAAERGYREQARTLFATAVSRWRASSGASESSLASALLDLAGAELRLEQSEAAFEAIREAESLVGPENHDLRASALILRGRLEEKRSDLESAEQLYHEAAAIAAPEGARRAHALFYVAGVLSLRGEGREADGLFREALGLYRRALGEDHPAVGRALLALGLLNEDLGRPTLATELIERAIEIFADAAGPDSVPVAEARVEYAMILREVDEAEAALEQVETALSVFDRSPETPALRHAYAMSARGFALEALDRNAEAALSLEEAVNAMREVRGPDSSDLPPGLIKLAEIYTGLGRHARAKERLREALRIVRKDSAFTPRLYGAALAAKASLESAQAQHEAALETGRQLLRLMRERLETPGSACSTNLGEQRAARKLFETFLEVAFAASPSSVTETLLDEMFQAAQFPHLTETAKTLAQTAQRLAPGTAERNKLLRRRQDLYDERCALETASLRALGGVDSSASPEPEALTARLDSIASELTFIQSEIAQSGFDKPSVLDPHPVSVSLLTPLLADDEALLLQFTGERATHLFLIGQSGIAHARTSLTARQLRRAVTTLREALNLKPGMAYTDLPNFPADDAHMLYTALFAPFEVRLGAIRTLLFVPDAEMRALPPGVLLTSRPEEAPDNLDTDGLAELDYLAKRLSISILPAPDALISLRQVASASDGKTPFIGIGDPLLGDRLSPSPGEPDDIARGVAGLMRSDGQAHPRLFRLMEPLPETRHELEQLAGAFGADPKQALVVGDRARESWVRTAAELRQARVIAFATHGLVSGELGALAEPALVLTPPTNTSSREDGLITASEIAALELNADWVILSACNTAAGRHPRAEGLSGLARAFMHAGARSLLVSHWYVSSQAAAALTVFAASALRDEPGRTRAEALQIASRRLMAGEHPDGTTAKIFAHPLFWAPFVNVGDGR